MSYYVGMDLHSSNTVIGIIDNQEKKIFSRRLPNDIHLILKQLERFSADVKSITFESTFNWYWLSDGLKGAGYEVHMANPCAIQQYKGLKYTNDQHDAYWLATLLKLGILPEGHIHSKPERQLRDLLRKRLMLVQQRTQHILSFKSLMNRNLCEHMRSNAIKTLKESDIDQLITDKHLNLSARANIAMMNFLNERIKLIEKEVLACARLKPEFKKLMTVPGIGKSLALTICLETGNINRFKSAGNYASYCRCVPSNRISNKKSKGQNNRKNGNKYLAWAFVEAANFAKRFNSVINKYYTKKQLKTNRIIAIKALAHKLSKACYYIIKDQVHFDEMKLLGIKKTQIKATEVNQNGDCLQTPCA
ncbi:MAG: IS110 family transposase [Bacteroidota bacterium]